MSDISKFERAVDEVFRWHQKETPYVDHFYDIVGHKCRYYRGYVSTAMEDASTVLGMQITRGTVIRGIEHKKRRLGLSTRAFWILGRHCGHPFITKEKITEEIDAGRLELSKCGGCGPGTENEILKWIGRPAKAGKYRALTCPHCGGFVRVVRLNKTVPMALLKL